MKLLPKFALFSLGVSVVPLAIAGYSSARVSQAELREHIKAHALMSASQVAEFVSSQVGNLQSILGVETRVLDLTRSGTQTPSAPLMEGFLRLVYHQSDDFSVVAALDEQGNLIALPAYQAAPNPNSAFGAHEAMEASDVTLLRQHVPLEEVLRDGASAGPVIPAGPRHTSQLVVAVRYLPGDQARPQIMAALVSLGRIRHYLAALASTENQVAVLDRSGQVVVSGSDEDPGVRDEIAARGRKNLPHALAGALPTADFVEEYSNGKQMVIGAFALATPFNLGVVVERPSEAALSPLRKLRWSTLYWMSISGLMAALVAAFLSRNLSTRVGALVRGARHIAKGRLNTRLAVHSNDELGELAKGFNAMATSLDAARGEILRQTDEIRAWNEALERRAQDKTQELREAQDLLLRSRSLAAIGSLGAGVAHEINNPLTGVLGMTQLLLDDLPGEHPFRPFLQDIVDQALRIQRIVSNLLRLAQRQSGEDFRIVDLARIVNDALELCSPKALAEAGIQVELNLPSPSPPVQGNDLQLQAALIELIQNARAAMGERGGRLALETSRPEETLLRLRITDTGGGIAAENLGRVFDPFFTTKTRWSDTGIGLSVVHQIIADHRGTIRVESVVGQGTTFWLTFPIATMSNQSAPLA